MTEPNQMQDLARKMGHDLADLLYLTKDDFFYAAQWQAAMKSLDDFVAEYERVKNDRFKEKTMTDNYASEEDTAELMRVGKLPKPLRLAAMLEKTMQWPLHGKSADCLREMYELLQRCENEMLDAGWDKREADNPVRNELYEQVKEILEKNI